MPAQLNALCQIPRLYLALSIVKAKGTVWVLMWDDT